MRSCFQSILFVCCFIALWLPCQVAKSITIQLNYDYGTFFNTHTTAKAALDAAAADISAAITTTLGEITEDDDPIIGTNGSTSATFDWKYAFTNPYSGATVELTTPVIAADTVSIAVGVRNLSGSTLGQGGPGGAGYQSGGGGSESEWIGAVADAETKSNAVHTRGSGPIMGSFSNSTTLGSTTADYTVSYGASFGHLWFDVDSDNDGSQDNDTLLDTYWHFDHTTSVESGKSDFYSVALHELLHAIGIGTSESWDDLVSGTNWLGSEAIEANGGSGSGLIYSDGAHIAEGTMSTRISDGLAQEAVMDPNLTVGTRKELTTLDLAFLRDIGFSTAVATAIPEPSTLAALSLLVLLATNRRGRILA
jgi:hypothetical protein